MVPAAVPSFACAEAAAEQSAVKFSITPSAARSVGRFSLRLGKLNCLLLSGILGGHRPSRGSAFDLVSRLEFSGRRRPLRHRLRVRLEGYRLHLGRLDRVCPRCREHLNVAECPDGFGRSELLGDLLADRGDLVSDRGGRGADCLLEVLGRCHEELELGIETRRADLPPAQRGRHLAPGLVELVELLLSTHRAGKVHRHSDFWCIAHSCSLVVRFQQNRTVAWSQRSLAHGRCPGSFRVGERHQKGIQQVGRTVQPGRQLFLVFEDAA